MRRLVPLLSIGIATLLSGCQYDAVLEDNYKPVTTEERYPIKVETAATKTALRAPRGTLNTEQLNAVANFAIEAKRSSSAKVQIRYPSGSAASKKLAQMIAQNLVDRGVPAARIWVGGYRGSATAPIELVMTRKVAVTKECGGWSDLSDTYGNTPHDALGCAVTNNMAAMIAHPEDLERPREMGPVLAANRTETMKIFVENSTTGDYWSFDMDGQSSKSP